MKSIFGYSIGFLWFLSISTLATSSEVKIGITQWGDTKGLFTFMKENNLPEDCENINDLNCVGGISQLLPYIDGAKQSMAGFTGNASSTFTFVTGNLVSGEHGYLSLFKGVKVGETETSNGWDFYGQLLNYIAPEPYLGNITKTELYRPNFMSLGIKEFEAGLERTNTYLRRTDASTKTVVSNVACTLTNSTPVEEKEFCANRTVRYEIMEVDGIKVGVVGFVNPLANYISDAGSMTFLDVANSIKKIVNANLTDTTFVIAVGSGSNAIAQEIIDSIGDKVQLVIYGGGTKNFTGKYPEKYKGSWIAGTDGSTYGTSIGTLKLTWNTVSKKLDITGNLQKVIRNDLDFPLNGLATKLLPEALQTSGANNDVIKTQVTLNGSRCWNEECNLGNLVTDSMVHCAYNFNSSVIEKKYNGTLEVHNEPIISLWHGGALHKDSVNRGEMVKVIDIHKWLPYHNRPYLVRVTGKTLWKLFEMSATGLGSNPSPNWGQFLQVSNEIQVTYDGNEVSKIRTLHLNDGIPQLENVQMETLYNLVIPSIMQKGKSVFGFLPSELQPIFTNHTINATFADIGFDDDCVMNYINAMGVISTGFDERIFLSDESGSSSCNKKTGLTVFLTLLISALIIGIAYGTWRFIIVPRRENNNCF